MLIDQIGDEFATVESEIAGGPIVPNVTAGEIRAHLQSRYDFTHTMALEDQRPENVGQLVEDETQRRLKTR